MRSKRSKQTGIFAGGIRLITRAILFFVAFMTVLYGQDFLENRYMRDVFRPAARTVAGISPAFNSNCLIKGNVSLNSGERIYHVPGQFFYDETVISWTRGERWFCSEAEAKAQGWRKARR
uniref:sunset domain-containing protein n=1 Tax=Pararhizobium sp. IMCC3301 TaxID=3067904 RepID=UPI00274253AF|nr:hypothetical protein [Pararhizobium sp. IMCC3301]